MNRIQQKLNQDKKILSIYFTAGFPRVNDTVSIIQALEKSGVDLIEIGMPFSDPLADGPTIQASSTQALQNGMTTDILFQQLENIRNEVKIPLILMGYFNPILQFGVENFCKKCAEIGIAGLIIPDLPIDVFKYKYESIFNENNLINIFLITPQTSESRIREIDKISKGFIYLVSSASITGAKNTFEKTQLDYFERIKKLNLKTPLITGFGISNKETFDLATQFSQGAIIGSAFIKNLEKKFNTEKIKEFVQQFR